MQQREVAEEWEKPNNATLKILKIKAISKHEQCTYVYLHTYITLHMYNVHTYNVIYEDYFDTFIIIMINIIIIGTIQFNYPSSKR